MEKCFHSKKNGENGKILQIFNKYLHPGGEEKSVERIYQTLKSKYDFARLIIPSQIWQGKNSPNKLEQAFFLLKNHNILRKVRQTHDCEQPDVWLIHNYLPIFSISLYNLAKELNVPVIQFCHNYRPFSLNGCFWAKGKLCINGMEGNYLPEIINASWQNSKTKSAWLATCLSYAKNRKFLDNVTSWIGISEFVQKTFIQCGIPEERVFALRHSWEIVNKNPADNPTKKNNYYLCLSRLNEEKGLKTLVLAWNIVKKKLTKNCPKLIICGEGELQDFLTKSCNKNNSIELLGFVTKNKKATLANNAKAFIAPSIWWEPLGLVTYEAYDYQKPMLSASSGGLTETVLHGKTGLLHQPGNHEELAQQIIHLEQNPTLLEQMGKAGRTWLKDNTSKQNWITKFDAIYDDTLARHKKINQSQKHKLTKKSLTIQSPKFKKLLFFGHTPPPSSRAEFYVSAPNKTLC